MRKKKNRLFKWKVVEAYRAERVQASELEEKLGISVTELRRLNRWYYRCRILPLLYPSKRHGPPGGRLMKRDADCVKLLERKLAEPQKEPQFLRSQAKAYQTVIQIAEEHGAARWFNIPIVKKPAGPPSRAKRPKN